MIFLSHTGADKPFVRQVGSQLQLVGEEVFFDEWSIAIGASIPGAIDVALRDYETFVLFWSSDALKSAWTVTEYRSAVSEFLANQSGRRLIVVRLDNEPLPSLVGHRRWIDARVERDPSKVVDGILGYTGNQRLLAMQEYLSSLDLHFGHFPGYGVAVACEGCGADASNLKGWMATDDAKDDTYAGVRCGLCGWEAGGEI